MGSRQGCQKSEAAAVLAVYSIGLLDEAATRRKKNQK